MSGLFAYCRVAPASLPPALASLLKEFAAAGLPVAANDVTVEAIHGSTTASARPDFQWLLHYRLYEGDTLVVLGLDSLGRDTKDQCSTLRLLAERGVRVHCPALGRVDVADKATMDVLRAVAHSEQAKVVEREHLGPSVDKVEMPPLKRRGRPYSLTPAQVVEARKLMAAGTSIVQVARRLETSRQTIIRMLKRASKDNSAHDICA